MLVSMFSILVYSFLHPQPLPPVSSAFYSVLFGWKYWNGTIFLSLRNNIIEKQEKEKAKSSFLFIFLLMLHLNETRESEVLAVRF